MFFWVSYIFCWDFRNFRWLEFDGLSMFVIVDEYIFCFGRIWMGKIFLDIMYFIFYMKLEKVFVLIKIYKEVGSFIIYFFFRMDLIE